MNKQVDEYIKNIGQPWQQVICNQLRTTIQEAAPDSEELWKWGKPLYKKNDEYLCDFATAKSWINFRILSGRGLTPPNDNFVKATDGSGLSIKITENQAVDYAAIAKLIKQAAANLS